MRHSRPFRLLFAALVAALILPAAGRSEPAKKDAKDRPTNRLIGETSPYLRMHAHNPVDWHPWGPEAFAKAKKEGKLVFLSIGYSSCYWCHVMERESFANSAVAKVLNERFVCIKVDREERPDVDNIYMTALHALGRQGGWPLSMFLTADAKPFIGGTYWPPDDRVIEGETVAGFKTVVKIVHDFATKEPKKFQEQSNRVAAATSDALAGSNRGVSLVDLDRNLMLDTVDAVKGEFDAVHGGFGSAKRDFRGSKFPTPPYLELLLYEADRTKARGTTDMLTLTLDRMARGGIYDQLGGGFHRYSTERTWTVPHFEKMLYDNAQLAEVYARAFRLTGKPEYRRIVQETLAFVAREMTSPEGAFYSALDAETHSEEGRFYVWTGAEIDAVLTDKDENALFRKVYGAADGPNFEGKYHIPTLPKPLAEVAGTLKLSEEQLQLRLAPIRQKLLDARARRDRPFLDTKVLTAWNGEMIAGYAAAGQLLTEPKYVEAAARAADFLLKNLRNKEGRLLRTYGAQPGKPAEARLNGYLDDYAYLVHGLLNLHDATKEQRWLGEARALTDTMVEFHGDKDRGGFFYTSNDHEKLFARSKDQYDGAQPAANSVAAQNLVRLAVKTGDARYRGLAEKSLKAFAGSLKLNPSGLTAMARGLALYLDAPAAGGSEESKKEEGRKKVKDSTSKVKATAKADKPDADGKQTVTLTLTVEEGWHLYRFPLPDDFPGVATTVTVTAKQKPEEVKVEYPPGKKVKDKIAGEYLSLEGTVEVKATVRRAKGDTSPLNVTVKVQTCSKDTCLLPGTIKLTVGE